MIAFGVFPWGTVGARLPPSGVLPIPVSLRTKIPDRSTFRLAEGGRFELPRGRPLAVFKTAAIAHSAIPPVPSITSAGGTGRTPRGSQEGGEAAGRRDYSLLPDDGSVRWRGDQRVPERRGGGQGSARCRSDGIHSDRNDARVHGR